MGLVQSLAETGDRTVYRVRGQRLRHDRLHPEQVRQHATSTNEAAYSPKPPEAKPPTKADREVNVVLGGAQFLKERAKKPETFELLNATMIDGKVICYTYRARNSFNDRMTEHYVISETVSSGTSKDWNKHCAGKQGDDYTYVRAVLR